MKIETIRKNYWKDIGIVSVVLVLVLVVLITNGTFAKYSASQSVPLTRGVVNYKAYDFKIMAMYQENDSGGYDEVEVMPTSDYVINEDKSYCYTTSTSVRDSNAELKTVDGNHVFNNLDKSSKCYVWFDEKPLANATIIGNAPSIQSMPSITGVSTETGNTLYTVEDDDGTSYVFRGNPSNNWVYFGGFYWRIIRVNGDGSVRLIYNGTSTATTGTGTQIGTGAFNSYTDTSADNAYVGYMYGNIRASTYAATHANTYDSTIKGTLDTWYGNNLTNYSSYIDANAGFCNDRQMSSFKFNTITLGTLGYQTNATGYAPMGRLYSNDWRTTQTPSLKCTNASNDLFTMKDSNKGNKKLTNPIGLITSDEAVYAGTFGSITNTSYYLYTGQVYWTMSPSMYAPGGYPCIFYISGTGKFNNLDYSDSANRGYGIRPVINLRSDVTLTGSGTSSDAYKIS